MEFLDVAETIDFDLVENYHQVRVVELSPAVTQKRLILSQIKSYIDVAVAWSASTVTLQNNWINFNETIFGSLLLRKMGSFVVFEGVVKNGTANANIALIDDDTFWPSHKRVCTVDTDSGAKRVDVFPTGEIRYYGANTAYVSLHLSYFL